MPPVTLAHNLAAQVPRSDTYALVGTATSDERAFGEVTRREQISGQKT